MLLPFVSPTLTPFTKSSEKSSAHWETDDKFPNCNRQQSSFRYQTASGFHGERKYSFGHGLHRTGWQPLCLRQGTCQSYPTLPLQIPKISYKTLRQSGMLSSPRKPYPSKRLNELIFEYLMCSYQLWHALKAQLMSLFCSVEEEQKEHSLILG